jgi:hypothetical protein
LLGLGDDDLPDRVNQEVHLLAHHCDVEVDVDQVSEVVDLRLDLLFDTVNDLVGALPTEGRQLARLGLPHPKQYVNQFYNAILEVPKSLSSEIYSST